MHQLSKAALTILSLCSILSLFSLSLRSEKDTPNLKTSPIAQLLVFINLKFVKLIWFWTMVVVTPFAVLFSVKIQSYSVYNFERTKAKKAKVRYSKVVPVLIRILIFGTTIWYLFTHLKRLWFQSTGRCLIEHSNKVILKATTPKLCNWYNVEKNAYWSGFNLSGHSFMLNFSSMITLTEIYTYQNLKRELKNQWFIKQLYRLCVAFLIACQVMVCITYLVYHRYFEKVFGTVLALFCWQVLYFDVCQKVGKRFPGFVASPAIVNERHLD